MSIKSRALYLVAAASLLFVTACGESVTSEPDFKVKRLTYEEMVAMGCGDQIPWGKAPCIDPQRF
ncbi:MAG: hypothetical protein ACO1Q7_13025 [Gemmatimonas sp.]